MPHPWRLSVSNDIVGGLMSAALAIPLAMGFGMFAFVSLGDEYFAGGALAGLYTAFWVAIVAVLLGDRTATVYAPRINSTFFLGALLYDLVHFDTALRLASTTLILVVFFSVILVGGIFQALFGLIRVGTLIRFAPQPVMAGFQNTAAALLFLVQLANVSGFDQTKPFPYVLMHLGEAKPLSLLLAALTCIVMWNAHKLVPKVPPLLVGIAFGTSLYYALIGLGLGGQLGPVIANKTQAILSPAPWDKLGQEVSVDTLIGLWPTVLGGGLALAIIASIDSLLCAKLVTPPGEPKADADLLLARLGIGNIVAASFGGITGGINIGPTLANRTFGGRTSVSVLVNAAAILLSFTLLFPIVTGLPRAVLSAVIMVVAIQHFDPWSTQLLKRIALDSGAKRHLLVLDLLVVTIIAVLSITLNIVLAVFVGTIIAVALFVARMSRSITRRSYRCDAISSRKSRNAVETQALERHSSSILVMELQGALFFGTGERLLDEIQGAMRRETRYLVLDLRRVNEVDSTGARIVLEIETDLRRKGSGVALVLRKDSDTAARLRDFGVLEKLPEGHVFEDVDRAIEWAEDNLLRDALPEAPSADAVPLDQASIMDGLTSDEIAILKTRLSSVRRPKGGMIFHQGDIGTELFIVTRGTASAYIHQAPGRDIRLATFAPGTVFGEFAILDAGPRSASVFAEEDFASYALSREQFAALSRDFPALAIKLLANLARELSGRLRRADRMIDELEM